MRIAGEKLRSMRVARCLTQEKLAEITRLTDRTIRKAEAGKAIGLSTVKALCEALGCKPDELLPITHVLTHEAAPPLSQPPDPPAVFVGRSRELRAVETKLVHGDPPHCIVSGMAGVGKTSLALASARNLTGAYPDGQLFVDLAGATEPWSPERAMQYVLWSLAPDRIFADRGARLYAAYTSALRDRRLLLILDNVAGLEQIRTLIPPAPNGLLVTSRKGFSIPGCAPIRLQPLERTDARRLVEKLAPRSHVSREVAELCGQLPLALTLAALALARPDRDPYEWASALADERMRLSLLDRDGSELGVEFSLAESLRGLPDSTAERFAALSVFPEDFERCAARAVWNLGEQATVQMLDDLVASSLLQHVEGRGTAARYRVHDLLRILAARRLSPKARQLAEIRMSRVYLHGLQGGDCEALGTRKASIELARWLEREQANVREGLRYAEAQSGESQDARQVVAQYYACVALQRALGTTRFLEGCRRAREAAKAHGDDDDAAKLGAILSLFGTSDGLGLAPELACFVVDMQLFEISTKARSLVNRGEIDRGIQQMERARELAAERKLEFQELAIRARLAGALELQGRWMEAWTLLEPLARVLNDTGELVLIELGDDLLTGLRLHLASVLVRIEQSERADGYLREVFASLDKQASLPIAAFACHLAGEVAEAMDRPDEAASKFAEASRVAVEMGAAFSWARAEIALARQELGAGLSEGRLSKLIEVEVVASQGEAQVRDLEDHRVRGEPSSRTRSPAFNLIGAICGELSRVREGLGDRASAQAHASRASRYLHAIGHAQASSWEKRAAALACSGTDAHPGGGLAIPYCGLWFAAAWR